MKQYTLILLTLLAIIPQFCSAAHTARIQQLETKSKAAASMSKSEPREQLLRLALNGYFTQNVRTTRKAEEMQRQTYKNGKELVAAAQERIVAYAEKQLKQLGKLAEYEETFLLEESIGEIEARWGVNTLTVFKKPIPLPIYNNQIQHVAPTDINKKLSLEQKKGLLALMIAKLQPTTPAWITELNEAYQKSLRGRDAEAATIFQGKRYGYAAICTQDMRPLLLSATELTNLYKGPTKYVASVMLELEGHIDAAIADIALQNDNLMQREKNPALYDEIAALIREIQQHEYSFYQVQTIQNFVHGRLKSKFKAYNQLSKATIALVNERILKQIFHKLFKATTDFTKDEQDPIDAFYLPHYALSASAPAYVATASEEMEIHPNAQMELLHQAQRYELASLCDPELRPFILTAQEMAQPYQGPVGYTKTISEHLQLLIEEEFEEVIHLPNTDIDFLTKRNACKTIGEYIAMMQAIIVEGIAGNFAAFYCLNEETLADINKIIKDLCLKSMQEIFDKSRMMKYGRIPKNRAPVTPATSLHIHSTEKQEKLITEAKRNTQALEETICQELLLSKEVNNLIPDMDLLKYPKLSPEDDSKIKQVIYALVQKRMPTRHLGMTPEQNARRLKAEATIKTKITNRVDQLLKAAKAKRSIPAFRFAEKLVDDPSTPVAPEATTPVAASSGAKTPVAGPEYAPKRAAEALETAAERQQRINAMYQSTVATEAPTPPLIGEALKAYEKAVKDGIITEVAAPEEELTLADENLLQYI